MSAAAPSHSLPYGLASRDSSSFGAKEKGQLSARLPLAGALMLGADQTTVKREFKSLRKLYDQRSIAVHGGKVPEVLDALFKSYHFMAQLLLMSIGKRRLAEDASWSGIIDMVFNAASP